MVRIAVPPLRDRLEDVDVLVAHFLQRFGRPLGITRVASEVSAVLRGFHWPGNVRQLRNVIERACALGQGPELRMEDLAPEVREQEAVMPIDAGDGGQGTFAEMKARRIAAMEKSYLEGLLKKHRGNVTHCSEEAGMSRSAFQKLMQKYGVRSSDFRE